MFLACRSSFSASRAACLAFSSCCLRLSSSAYAVTAPIIAAAVVPHKTEPSMPECCGAFFDASIDTNSLTLLLESSIRDEDGL